MGTLTLDDGKIIAESLIKAMKGSGFGGGGWSGMGGGTGGTSGGHSSGGSGTSNLTKKFQKDFVGRVKEFSGDFGDAMIEASKYARAAKDASLAHKDQAMAFRRQIMASSRFTEQLTNQAVDSAVNGIYNSFNGMEVPFKALKEKANITARGLSDFMNAAAEGIGDVKVITGQTTLNQGDLNGKADQQVAVFEALSNVYEFSDELKEAASNMHSAFDAVEKREAQLQELKQNELYVNAQTGMLLNAEETAALLELEKQIDETEKALVSETAARNVAELRLNNFADTLVNATNETSKITAKIEHEAKVRTIAAKSLEALSDATGGLIPRTLSLSAGMLLIGAGAKQLFNEFKATASAGLSGHFFDIAGSSVLLGVSQATLIEEFNKSKRDILLMGSKGFQDAMAQTTDSFRQLGLSGDEAYKAAGSFHRMAVASGVNTKDSIAYNDVMNKNIKSFETLRAVTGISAEQFAAMNEEILSSTENQQMMLRYGAQERGQFLEKINRTRQELVMMGLSADAAQKMTQAMLGFEKTKLKDRIDAAARIQQAAGIAGMGGEGSKAAEIMRKNSKSRTAEETAFLADFSGRLQGNLQEMSQGGMGYENLVDNLDDSMGAAAKGLLDAGTQLKLAADAQRGITAEEAGTEADKNKLSDTTKNAIRANDMLTQAMNSGFAKVLAGMGTIVATMIITSKGGAGGFLAGAIETLSAMGSFISPILSGLAGALKFLGIAGLVISTLFSAFDNFGKFFSSDQGFGGMILDGVQLIFKSILDGVIGGVLKLVDGLASVFGVKLGLADKYQKISDEYLTSAEMKKTAAVKKSTDATKAQTKAEQEKANIVNSAGIGSVSADSLLASASVAQPTASISADKVDASNKSETEKKKEAEAAAKTATPESANSTTINNNTTEKKTKTLDDAVEVLNNILTAIKDGDENLANALKKRGGSSFSLFPEPMNYNNARNIPA